MRELPSYVLVSPLFPVHGLASLDVGSLVGHMIYGLLLGVVVATLTAR